MGEAVAGRGRLRDGLLIAAILLLGLWLRAGYLSEIAREPTFTHPLRDAGFHDYWARGLVSGDWTAAHGQPDPHISTAPFLRPPGYPYFLAGVYAATGGSHLAARVAQMLLGLLNVWLVYRLGRALFDRRAGAGARGDAAGSEGASRADASHDPPWLGRAAALLAALVCAVYWGLIYAEGQLEAPALTLALALGAVLLLLRWRDRRRARDLAGSGLLLGLLALVYPNALVFLPAAAAWAWWVEGRAPAAGGGLGRDAARRRLRRALVPALLLAAALLAISPATIRNAVVSGELVPIALNGPITFYSGNQPGADGLGADLPEFAADLGTEGWSWFLFDRIVAAVSKRAGRELSPAEASDWLGREAWRAIAREPGRFLGLCARRALLFLGPAEVTNGEPLATVRARHASLRWSPGFPFVIGAGLSGIGLLLARRWRWREAVTGERAAPAGNSREVVEVAPLLLPLLFVVVQFLTVVFFVVLWRYRVPVVPFLALFGGYALAWIAARCAAHARRAAAAATLLVAALVALFSIPLVPYAADPLTERLDRAVALERSGETARAIGEYRAILRDSPGQTRLRVKLAVLLAERGETGEALEHYRIAMAQRPEDLELRLSWTALLIDAGRAEEAREALVAIVAAHPGLATAQFQLGCALARLGEWAGAQRTLTRALQIDPRQPLAQLYLGISLAQLGDHPRALEAYDEALRLDPRLADAQVNRAQSLRTLGRRAEALAALEAALAIDPGQRAARQLREALLR